MLPDTAVSLPHTATTATSFDPWDMPYFGAATFFSYQAALWHPGGPGSYAAVPAASGPTTESSLPSDPWDAPYFGETVYLSYSPALPDRPVQPAPAPLSTSAAISVFPNVQPDLPPGSTAPDSRIGEEPPAENVPARPGKRSWWTRLFGQR